MRAFRNKKEFYDMLWADYQEYRRKVNNKEYDREAMLKCFIYKYYLDKKTQKAKALAENADGFEKYLGDYTGKNAENKKKRCDKFILLCAAKQVCGADQERFGGIFSMVAERENGGKHYTELFKTDPDGAYEELTYKFLCGSIQDMFFKKGYIQPFDKELYDKYWVDYQKYQNKINKNEYYKESMRECLIYKNFMKNKTAAAKKLANDADRFEEYLKDYLCEIDECKKKRRDKFILLCSAKQICGEDKSKFGEIFSKVAERENDGKHYTELFKTDPDRAYDELTHKFLCETIRDEFLTKGYIQPEGNVEGGEIGNSAELPTETTPKNGGDGYADEIELMHKYFVHAGGGSITAGSQAEISDEYIGKCEKLYERLLKTDSGMEFIPLYIDPSSGAGVYIIGDGIPKTGSKKYHVYILSFNWCGGYESDKDAEGVYETLDSQYDMKSFESVREAFKSFSEKVGGDEYYFAYTGYNQNILDRIPVNEVDEHFIPMMIAAEDLAMRAAESREKQKRAGLEKEAEGKAKYFQPMEPT